MTDLDGAMPQQYEYKKTELKTLGRGGHRGYFVGLGATIEETAQCKICKGRKIAFSQKSQQEEPCRRCNQTGRTVEKKVALVYEVAKGQYEEEWVNYKLSGPGVLRDGTAKGATTLFKRMRSFSGGIKDEKELSAWFKSLPKDEHKRLVNRIPVEIMVEDNEKGDRLIISSVQKLVKRSEPEYKPDPEFLDDEAFA